jgi:hypothetical protein
MANLESLEKQVWDRLDRAMEHKETAKLRLLSALADEMESNGRSWSQRLAAIDLEPPSGACDAGGVARPHQPLLDGTASADDVTGRSLRSAVLLGQPLRARNFKELLLEVAKTLHLETAEDFETKAVTVRGRFPYFSTDRNELHSPQPVGKSGLFVETTLNANSVVRICRKLLQALGHDPASLVIELEPLSELGGRRRRRHREEEYI